MRLQFFIFLALMVSQTVHAEENSLAVSTKSQVDERGGVTVFLTLKNTGSRPLFEIHPMFHFHHTNSMMATIPKLEPGKTVVLENNEHPPVVRVGRYPLVVMAHYKNNREQSVPFTALHTDSFYYREPVISAVEGRIESVVESKGSLADIAYAIPVAVLLIGVGNEGAVVAGVAHTVAAPALRILLEGIRDREAIVDEIIDAVGVLIARSDVGEEFQHDGLPVDQGAGQERHLEYPDELEVPRHGIPRRALAEARVHPAPGAELDTVADAGHAPGRQRGRDLDREGIAVRHLERVAGEDGVACHRVE